MALVLPLIILCQQALPLLLHILQLLVILATKHSLCTPTHVDACVSRAAGRLSCHLSLPSTRFSFQ